MEKQWAIESIDSGIASGKITHRQFPVFTAHWDTGPEPLEKITGPCWSDIGSGGEDQIHIFGFHWSETFTDQKSFEALMQDAVSAIDAWIASKM